MLTERIAERDGVRICVIGVGYIGLPLAIHFAQEGFFVTGVDIDKRIVDELTAGRSTVEGVSDSQVDAVVNGSRKLTLLTVAAETSNNTPDVLRSLTGTDVFIVCVPTPLHKDRGWEPETRWIQKAGQLICLVGEEEEKTSKLPSERLIVLESTTYPGTTRKIFSAVCERLGQKGTLCLLAYSPERFSPGPAIKTNTDENDPAARSFDPFGIPRIVGGINKASSDAAQALYQTVFQRVHPVDSPEAAEMIKLVENTFRFISIGFANEMARVARSFGLNIWDIIEAAKTKGFGLDLCFPGLIGGHCLPIDPHYLGWAYRNRRNVATFVDVAERSHQDARRDALDLTLRILCQQGKGVPGSSILFLGVAYKKNVGDTRESGVLDLMRKLYSYGANLSFWDPVRARQLVKHDLRLTFTEAERRQFCGMAVEGLTTGDNGNRYYSPRELEGDWEQVRNEVLCRSFDCIVLATDHADFHSAYYELLTAEGGAPIVDINNAVTMWLRTAELTPEQHDSVRRAIHDRSHFMLFGYD